MKSPGRCEEQEELVEFVGILGTITQCYRMERNDESSYSLNDEKAAYPDSFC
jgi:hypothetical protein